MLKAFYDYLLAIDKFCDEYDIEKKEFPLVLPKEVIDKLITMQDQEPRKLKARNIPKRGFRGFSYTFNNKNYELVYSETLDRSLNEHT